MEQVNRDAETSAEAIQPAVPQIASRVRPFKEKKTVVEKKKEKKERKEKKESRKTATGDGRHGDPSLGLQNGIIIPDTVGDIERAVFDTAHFERELLLPLPLTPGGVKGQVPVRQVWRSVTRIAPPPDDWRAEMRREMREMMQEFMPAVRPMGANSIRSQVNRPSGSLPQSPTTLLRPVPMTGQVSQPLGSVALPHQNPLTSAPRGAVVLEGDYRATRMLPEAALQRQRSGAMRAPVEMDRSDDQEVSFTGLVLDDNAMAEDHREVEYNPFPRSRWIGRVFADRFGVGAI